MHSIRLRGPWEFSIRGSGASGRIDFPCTWQQLVDAAGGSIGEGIKLARRFNKPTGLEAGDRVLVWLRSPAAKLTAALNGTPLALQDQPDGSWQAEITTLLADRNELTVELAPPSPPLPAVADASLEVELRIEPRGPTANQGI